METKSPIPAGWRFDLLDNIAKRGSGHTPDKSKSSYWNGGIKWISLADSSQLDNGYIYATDKEISEEGLQNSSAVLYPAETVVLSRDAGVGKSAVLATPMAVSQHFMAWQCDNRHTLHSWFLYYWLQMMKPEFERQAVGSTIKTIGLPYFKKLKILAPSYTEQTKIAQILSTWDKAIATTERLLANSQQQKQALMQQLLTGTARFPNSEGEWHEVEIGNIIKEVKRPVIWDDEAQYRLLSVKRRAEGVVLREVLAGSQILTKKMNTARAGDFLISKMQVTHGAMGLVTDEFDKHHISDSYIATIAKDPTKLDINFFSWLGRTKAMWRLAFLSSYGVHIEKLTFNFSLFLKEKINIPTSLAEQKKIAQVLSTADTEITNLQAQLAKLKLEKKALMQQLLTGKRRVRLDDDEEDMAPIRRVG